jgi:hypothetical protein
MERMRGTAAGCLACLGVAILTCCAAPRAARDPGKQKQPEGGTEKSSLGKTTSEFSESLVYPRKMSSKLENGSCSVNAESGQVTYEMKTGETVTVPFLPFDIVGPLVSLFCGEKQTIVVAAGSIAVHNAGYGGSEDSKYEDFFGESAVDGSTFYTHKDHQNIASVILGENLFNLARDTSSGVCDMNIIDLRELGSRTFELGKAFENGAVMKACHGMVLCAGEARKGETYLAVTRLGDVLEGVTFDAKKDALGEVSFEENEAGLVLYIGKNRTSITFEKKNKDLSNEDSITCFKPAGKDSLFECVVLGSAF